MGAAPRNTSHMGNKHTNDHTQHTELILPKAGEKEPSKKKGERKREEQGGKEEARKRQGGTHCMNAGCGDNRKCDEFTGGERPKNIRCLREGKTTKHTPPRAVSLHARHR